MRQRAQDSSISPDRSAGGPSQPRELYQSDFGNRVGHGQQQTLRNSFQPFAYHQRPTPSYFVPPPLMMNIIQDNPSLEDSFNREREQQMIEAIGQQQQQMENPPNVFENNHSQSSSNYDDSTLHNEQQ